MATGVNIASNTFKLNQNVLLLKNITGEDGTCYEPGKLFQYVSTDDDEYRCFKCDAHQHISIRTRESCMSHIKDNELHLILPLKPTHRIHFFMNKLWLEQVSSLRLGDKVVVFNKICLEKEVLGELCYIGPLATKKGCWFGVVLDEEYKTMGVHNGIWQGKRIFQCAEERGFFLNAFQIRPLLSVYEGIELGIGHRVGWLSDKDIYEEGCVRWLGFLDDTTRRDIENVMVGVGFDNAVGSGTGKYKSKQLFYARKGHAGLIPIMGLVPTKKKSITSNYFESDCAISPELQGLSELAINDTNKTSDMALVDKLSDLKTSVKKEKDILTKADHLGMYEGIQGKDNSCYLDTVIFSLYRYRTTLDHTFADTVWEESKENAFVRRSLLNIVYTLRRDSYVPAAMMGEFRRGFGNIFPLGGFLGDTRDPEEFIEHLFGQCLKLPQFLDMNTKQKSFMHQLLPDVQQVGSPGCSVQNLLFQSFLRCNVRLMRLPSLLLLQMPRYNTETKLFEHIFPNPLINVGDLIIDCTRRCSQCGAAAVYQCSECLSADATDLSLVTFCGECSVKMHSSPNTSSHKRTLCHVKTQNATPNSCFINRREAAQRNTTMELFAVICIRTSHYVCFAKSRISDPSSWVFFDSMASVDDDNIIPRVCPCPEVGFWLAETNRVEIFQGIPKTAPPLVRRLFTDAYMCLYE